MVSRKVQSMSTVGGSIDSSKTCSRVGDAHSNVESLTKVANEM